MEGKDHTSRSKADHDDIPVRAVGVCQQLPDFHLVPSFQVGRSGTADFQGELAVLPLYPVINAVS
jgi:hypothetical protein